MGVLYKKFLYGIHLFLWMHIALIDPFDVLFLRVLKPYMGRQRLDAGHKSGTCSSALATELSVPLNIEAPSINVLSIK